MATDTLVSPSRGHWRDYAELCKPRVVGLIVFTAVIGMFLSTPGFVPWSVLLPATLGIALAAASAAAINHVAEHRIDALMARTRHRPLPQGGLSRRHALAFALLIGALSMYLLVAFVNVLTAVLTFASLIGYAVVYTMYLKYATPQNIVIGGAAGAAPPVLGWTAVTGSVDPHALLLFLIIFAWTPPHWASPSTGATTTRRRRSPCCRLRMGSITRASRSCSYPDPDRRHPAAVRDVHERPDLSRRRLGVGRRLPLLRGAHAVRPRRCAGHAHLPLFHRLPHAVVRGVLPRSLLARAQRFRHGT